MTVDGTRKSQHGFTLIEILVAILILSLGVLGLIGMETVALKNNMSAYHRSQATLLAYDLSDKMRGNPAGVSAGEYISALPSGTEHDNICVSYTGSVTGSTCDSEKIAEREVYEWQQQIGAILPNGVGTMVLVSGVHTVTISWDDDRDGNVDDNFIFSFEL